MRWVHVITGTWTNKSTPLVQRCSSSSSSSSLWWNDSNNQLPATRAMGEAADEMHPAQYVQHMAPRSVRPARGWHLHRPHNPPIRL
jgi:hypothetical protein